MTLALNVAEPVLAGDFAKAAFDSVGPLLLIGWAEVGPGLLQAINESEVCPARDSWRETMDRAIHTDMDLQEEGDHGVARRVRVSSRTTSCWSAHARRTSSTGRSSGGRSAETLRKRLHVGAARSRMLVAMVLRNQHPGRMDIGSALKHPRKPVR